MKKMVMLGSGILLFCFICIVVYNQGKTIPVLGYHAFSREKEQDMFILPIDAFEKQLYFLKSHHYKTLTLKEFEMYKKKKKFPRKSVLITMDDGYQSNYDLAFPLLKKYNMNAVVFYIGSNQDGSNKQYMSKETIEQIKKHYPNIEVASHSFDLHHEGDIQKGTSYLEEDFHKMKDIIKTKYYAYPYGFYNKDMITTLKEEHYHLAFTFGPGKNHRKASVDDNNYLIPRLNITNGMPLWKFMLRIKFPL